jgi:hypothetical protein
MKNQFRSTAFWLALLTGLALIFIGLRFIIAPEIAEAGFGIHVNENGDHSFHYIKGIRDFFTGLIIVVLLFSREYRALGWLSLCGSLIPTTDLWIVVSHPGYDPARIYPHLSAVIISIGLGIYYLVKTRKKAVI